MRMIFFCQIDYWLKKKQEQGIKFKVLESPYDEEQNRSLITDPHSFAKFTANKKASTLVNELIKNSEHPDILIGGISTL